MVAPEHIENAAYDYYDKYWKDYWQRLRDKHAATVTSHPVPASPNWLTYPGGEGPGRGKHVVLVGDYKPLASGFNYEKLGVVPNDASVLPIVTN